MIYNSSKKFHNMNRCWIIFNVQSFCLAPKMAEMHDLHSNHILSLWSQRIFFQRFRDKWFKCVSAIRSLLSRLAVSVYESWHRRSIAQPCITECVLMCLDIKDEPAFRSLVHLWGCVDVTKCPNRFLLDQYSCWRLHFTQWCVCVSNTGRCGWLTSGQNSSPGRVLYSTIQKIEHFIKSSSTSASLHICCCCSHTWNLPFQPDINYLPDTVLYVCPHSDLPNFIYGREILTFRFA